MKKLYTLIAVAITAIGFAQYSGNGTFSKVTGLSNLTDGYYVVTNETDTFLMSSDRSGNANTGFFTHEAVTTTNNSIENPLPKNVWKIESTVNGKTIYNETISGYIGWSSANSASVTNSVTNSSTWIFSYSNDKFTVNNFGTPIRQLSYNSTNPRFAAYENSNQQELQFYKLAEVILEIPLFNVSTATLTGLDYVDGEGPSESQNFELSGINLNGSNVNVNAPANFEVSIDNVNFENTITLTGYEGEGTTIYIRLKEGLEINTYGGLININGGGVFGITVIPISGEVIEDVPIFQFPALIVNPEALEGLTYVEGEGPSVSQSFELTGTNLNGTDVEVNSPDNFEISIDNSNFQETITLTEYNGEATTIYVRLKGNLEIGTYNENITMNGGGIFGIMLAPLEGEVLENETIIEFPDFNVNPGTLAGLAYIEDQGPSASQSFELTGTYLNGTDVSILISESFEVSIDDLNFEETITLSEYDGEATTIYVRLKEGLDVDSYTGFININGGGVFGITLIPISGQVLESEPTFEFPTLTANPGSLTGLTYVVEQGPSASQSFELSGTDLNGTDVSILVPDNFEVSIDDSTFQDLITLPEYDGEVITVYIRLKEGLQVDTYNDVMVIVGGGTFGFTLVSLEGEVLENETIIEFPTLVANPNSLTGLTYVVEQGPSASQSFELTGTDLNGTDVSILVPDNFEISIDDSTFQDLITLTEYDGEAITIYIRLKEGLEVDTYGDVMILVGGGTFGFTLVPIEGQVLEDETIIEFPTLVANPDSLTGLTYVVDQGPSASQSFDLTGENLLGSDVNINSPNTNFEISIDDSNFQSTITLPEYDGETTTIYVRLKEGLDVDSYNGNITINGGGVFGFVIIPVEGEVLEDEIIIEFPTLVANPNSLTGLTYVVEQGPSASQSFELTGTDLNGTDVSILVPDDFEISIDDSNFQDIITLPEYNGEAITVYVRLKEGLEVDMYNDVMVIVGGGTFGFTLISLEGEVLEDETIIEFPTLAANPDSLTDLTYIVEEGPSASQSFVLTGTYLDGTDVTIDTAINFEVSFDDSDFQNLITLPEYDGEATTIYVRLKEGLEIDDYNGFIAINGGGVFGPTLVALEGAVVEDETIIEFPTLVANPDSLTGLTYVVEEGPSASQGFELTGMHLDGTDVTIDAAASFEVSLDDSDFQDLITLPEYDGEATTIYVRLKEGLEVDDYNGFITINGGGIFGPTLVSVSGEVTDTASINENNIDGLRIYPNPATDIVNITSNEIGSIEVIIYDMLGKKVLKTSTNESVNVSSLNSGAYIMNITQGGKKATRKLIIK